MTRKVLFCATVDYHFKAFHLPYMRWFKEQGWEVHIAAKGRLELPYVDKKVDLPIQRSPFKPTNRRAYSQLKAMIDEHRYELIHCHTPVGGVLARLAAREARKLGTKVIYTAHGFHFCKGAPLVNWLIYYPLEKLLSSFTDCLITINEEDYRLAVGPRFHAVQTERVHGVGVDPERYHPMKESEKSEERKAFGYQSEDFLFFYAAEFNKNKNQQMLISALAAIHKELPHARLLLAGDGPQLQLCRELAGQLHISDRVDFLGYRNDLDRLVPVCDVALASSLREGLPVNIMEAMACGLPIIATDNRGHRELVQNLDNGWLVDPADPNGMADKMLLLARDPALRTNLGTSGRAKIQSMYAIDKVLVEMSRIYTALIGAKVGAAWASR